MKKSILYAMAVAGLFTASTATAQVVKPMVGELTGGTVIGAPMRPADPVAADPMRVPDKPMNKEELISVKGSVTAKDTSVTFDICYKNGDKKTTEKGKCIRTQIRPNTGVAWAKADGLNSTLDYKTKKSLADQLKDKIKKGTVLSRIDGDNGNLVVNGKTNIEIVVTPLGKDDHKVEFKDK